MELAEIYKTFSLYRHVFPMILWILHNWEWKNMILGNSVKMQLMAKNTKKVQNNVIVHSPDPYSKG